MCVSNWSAVRGGRSSARNSRGREGLEEGAQRATVLLLCVAGLKFREEFNLRTNKAGQIRCVIASLCWRTCHVVSVQQEPDARRSASDFKVALDWSEQTRSGAVTDQVQCSGCH